MKQRKYWIAGIAGLVVLFGGIVSFGDPARAALFAGRFHPLVVHLPIGLLLLAGALEAAAYLPRFAHVRAAVPFVLGAGVLSALAAVATGLLLASGGGYDDGVLYWHKRLGIGVVVVAVAALAVRWFVGGEGGQARRIYQGTLGALLLLVTGAGHFGGVLTHGSGYLTDHLPEVVRTAMALPARGAPAPTFERIDEAVVYTDLVRPILETRCVGCHGPEKQRGDLRLDAPEGLEAGGEGGPVLTAGDAAASRLYRYVVLPPGHEDHMPPEGRPQLTVAEAELLRWWIDAGASFEQTVAEAGQTPVVETILEAAYGGRDRPTGVFALDVDAPDAAAVAALEAAGAEVTPLARDVPLLQVRFPGTVVPGALAALRPLSAQVTWLDLSGTDVDDAALADLARLEHLTRLRLDHTAVTDAGLANLSGLEYLEYLNLVGTAVTDAGLQHLSTLQRLRRLYLWQSGATPAGVAALLAALPSLDANTGVPDTTATAAPDAAPDATAATP